MAGLNQVFLIGNLGRDPELRYTKAGLPVCNFTMATSEKYKDGAGQFQERVEWHRIVVWGSSAEACQKFLEKGRSVFVQGRINTRDWEDKQGNKQKSTEIVATSVQFLGSRDGDQRQERTPPNSQVEDDGDLPF